MHVRFHRTLEELSSLSIVSFAIVRFADFDQQRRAVIPLVKRTEIAGKRLFVLVGQLWELVVGPVDVALEFSHLRSIEALVALLYLNYNFL